MPPNNRFLPTIYRGPTDGEAFLLKRLEAIEKIAAEALNKTPDVTGIYKGPADPLEEAIIEIGSDADEHRENFHHLYGDGYHIRMPGILKQWTTDTLDTLAVRPRGKLIANLISSTVPNAWGNWFYPSKVRHGRGR